MKMSRKNKGPDHIEDKSKRDLFKTTGLLAAGAVAGSIGTIAAQKKLEEEPQYSAIEKILNKEPIGVAGSTYINDGPRMLTYFINLDLDWDRKVDSRINQIYHNINPDDRLKTKDCPVDEVLFRIDRDFEGNMDRSLTLKRDFLEFSINDNSGSTEKRLTIEKEKDGYTAKIRNFKDVYSQPSIHYTFDKDFKPATARITSNRSPFITIDYKSNTVSFDAKSYRIGFNKEKIERLSMHDIENEAMEYGEQIIAADRKIDGKKADEDDQYYPVAKLILDPNKDMTLTESIISMSEILPRVFEGNYKVWHLRQTVMDIDKQENVKEAFEVAYGVGFKAGYMIKKLFEKPELKK